MLGWGNIAPNISLLYLVGFKALSFEDVVTFRCRSQTGINSPVMSKKKTSKVVSRDSHFLIGLVLSTLTDLYHGHQLRYMYKRLTLLLSICCSKIKILLFDLRISFSQTT